MSRGNRSQPARERTPEERERAREERERRRAGRSDGAEANGLAEATPAGQLPSQEARDVDESFESPLPPAGDPPTPLEPPVPHEPPSLEPPSLEPPFLEPPPLEPTPLEPPPIDPPPIDPPSLDPPVPYEPPVSMESSAGSEPSAAASPPTEELPVVARSAPEHLSAPPAEELSAAAPSAQAGASPEQEAPTVPAPAPAQPVATRPEADLPRFSRLRGGTPLPSRAGLGARGRTGRSLLARLLALVALAVVIAAVALLFRSLLGSSPPKTVAVPAVVSVLIPEGETRLQIAKLAAEDGLTGSYSDASRRSGTLNPVHYGAPRATTDLEGFLFPATYEMKRHAPVGSLVREQLVAFKENFGAEETRRAHALHLTSYELLTVASMIEREAQVPTDRAKIAAVIYNRLRQRMPLGIDATIYYALEHREGIAAYAHELTEAQLHIDSPYNTRTHAGLPPTPISNPGLASIRAAAHPAHVAYLYYVLAADGCGEHVFSATLAQFEVDAAAYQAALKKNHGKPPSCKKK